MQCKECKEAKEELIENINKISKPLSNPTKKESKNDKIRDENGVFLYPKNMHCINLKI